jgi:hypothetical protein
LAIGPSSGRIFIPTVKAPTCFVTQPHPNRAIDDPLEAESENPRERQILVNTNSTRDMVLSPHNQRGGEDQEREAEDVAEGNFEINLVDAGVEDEDIASLRRIEERLAAKIRERTMSPNIQTRAQAEAAILRAKEIQNGELVQEKPSTMRCYNK